MTITRRLVQPSILRGEPRQRIFLFGKYFELDPVSADCRIVRHEDFIWLEDADIDNFCWFSHGVEKIVVTGCKVAVHPYRLMAEVSPGRIDYLLDIPQAVRGSRQAYPEVFCFVPALVSIPAGMTTNCLHEPSQFQMFVICPEKLLDKTIQADILFQEASARLKREP